MTQDEPLAGDAVKAWRQGKRRELLLLRAALTPEERARKSEQVLSRVLAGWDRDEFLSVKGRIVGAYWPFRGEVDVLPLLDEVRRRGGEIALPVVVGRGRPLEFRRWQPGDPMHHGVYNIPYPAREDRVEPDLLVVALLGFDPACYRLGYGGGYYDRTLVAAARKPFTIGIGFELGRLATIHPQPYDVRLDRIVTEAQVLTRVTADPSGAARARS